LVDPEEVTRVVEKRARQHPKRGTDDGFLAPRGGELEDHKSVYFVLAPYDHEEREVFLKQLRSPSGIDRAAAAGHLAHYPAAGLTAPPKASLADDYTNPHLVDAAPGRRPGAASVYVVRRAAYESPRKLNVDVPKPDLDPRR